MLHYLILNKYTTSQEIADIIKQTYKITAHCTACRVSMQCARTVMLLLRCSPDRTEIRTERPSPRYSELWILRTSK